MFKQSEPIVYEVRPARSKSKLARIIFILAPAALLAPLAAEGRRSATLNGLRLWANPLRYRLRSSTRWRAAFNTFEICLRTVLGQHSGARSMTRPSRCRSLRSSLSWRWQC